MFKEQTNHVRRNLSSILSKTEMAVKKAVHKVVKELKRTGEPLIV